MKQRTWTEKQLKKAVKDARSYRQALSFLKLKEAGGNYAQLKKYIKEFGLDISHFKGRGWNRGMHFPLARIYLPILHIHCS